MQSRHRPSRTHWHVDARLDTPPQAIAYAAIVPTQMQAIAEARKLALDALPEGGHVEYGLYGYGRSSRPFFWTIYDAQPPVVLQEPGHLVGTVTVSGPCSEQHTA